MEAKRTALESITEKKLAEATESERDHSSKACNPSGYRLRRPVLLLVITTVKGFISFEGRINWGKTGEG